MSNKRKAPNARIARRASSEAADEPQHRVRLSAPADVLAVVPYLLGFHPTESLVVMGVGGSRLRVRFTTRMDLPAVGQDDAVREAIGRLAQMVAGQSAHQAILVAYGEEPRARYAVDFMCEALRANDVEIREALRAQGGRYWSYECTNPSCCPPEGTPYDTDTSPVAAAATVAGCVALPDREALGQSIAPIGGSTGVSMRQATARAEEWLAAGAAASSAGGTLREHVLEQGRSCLAKTLDCFRDGDRLPSDDDTALLSVALRHLRVRDEAWLAVNDDRAAHLALWTHVVRRAEEFYVPAPACLLAFAAWQDGNGALASFAVDRALEADPEYSMAHLLRGVLERGISPDEWDPQVTAEGAGAGWQRPAV